MTRSITGLPPELFCVAAPGPDTAQRKYINLFFIARTTNAATVQQVIDCLTSIVFNNAAPALVHAWLHSLGGIRHPETPAGQLTAAQAFAADYIALTNSPALGHPPYKAILLAVEKLNADRDAATRFFPRAVKLVTEATDPPAKFEITRAAALAKIKTELGGAESVE